MKIIYLRKFLYPKTMNIICQFTFDLKIRSNKGDSSLESKRF